MSSQVIQIFFLSFCVHVKHTMAYDILLKGIKKAAERNFLISYQSNFLNDVINIFFPLLEISLSLLLFLSCSQILNVEICSTSFLLFFAYTQLSRHV